MGTAAIIKILLLAVGGLTVINHVPGVHILGGDEKSDYKALVRCEAKYEGAQRRYGELEKKLEAEEKTVDRLERNLKDERKQREKAEKSLKEYISDSVRSSRNHERHSRSRDRVRGEEPGPRGDTGSRRSLFPWRR